MFFPDVNDFLEEEKNWGGKKIKENRKMLTVERFVKIILLL